MAIEITRNEVNDKDSNLFRNRELLSFMLWHKYIESRDQESPFSVVCFGDHYGYEVGHVYMDLRFDSTIHPSCYTNLTWGEFYRWYGVYDWELKGTGLAQTPEFKEWVLSPKLSLCFYEKEGIRPLQEIILDHINKHQPKES